LSNDINTSDVIKLLTYAVSYRGLIAAETRSKQFFLSLAI